MRFELFSKLIINGFLNVLSVKDRAWDRANLLIPDNEKTGFFVIPFESNRPSLFFWIT